MQGMLRLMMQKMQRRTYKSSNGITEYELNGAVALRLVFLE